VEQRYRFIKIETRISDALTVDQWTARRQILVASHQMTLEHDPDQRSLTLRDLIGHTGGNFRLSGVLFGAVAMAAVHNNGRLNAGRVQQTNCMLDMFRCVIRPCPASTAQDQVCMFVARCFQYRRHTLMRQ
jgi:hypothetical protein